MAGIELTELLDQPSHIHKYVFAFLFGLFAIWHAYILARAIHQLRDDKMGADSD